MSALLVTQTLAKINDTGRYVLREMICNGEEYRQENNRARLSPLRCDLPYSTRRSGISDSTVKALARKGIVKRSYPDHLTPFGVKVAREHIEQWLTEDGNGNFEDGAIATTVTTYVEGYMKLRKAELDKRKAELDRLCHLFRGIRIKNAYGRKRAFSTELREHFDGGGSINGMRLTQWELVEIGEEIEKLR